MNTAAPTLKRSLDAQREQWERALSERADRFGAEAESARSRYGGEVAARGADTTARTGGPARAGSRSSSPSGASTVHALDYAATAVEAIEQKARQAELAGRVTVAQHDVRDPLPYPDASFDACYSHMLFCMALTEAELRLLSQEILRVLSLCIYTARTTDDPDFGKGIHHGDGLYESGGFTVHFFSTKTVARLADGYENIEVERFEEGPLPRKLFQVTLRKPAPEATSR